jgi:DNA-binding MarR family transcriptional regulator
MAVLYLHYVTVMRGDPESFAAEMARQCLSSRVGRLHRIVTRRFELALAPTGLTPPQLEILAALTLAGEPVPPSALAGVLAVERSTMSRNLALMKERGWVEPATVSPAGRTMTVTVTDRGRATFLDARDAWNAAQRAVAEALGEQAAGGIDDWLEGLAGSSP